MPGSHTHLKGSLTSPDPNVDSRDLVAQMRTCSRSQAFSYSAFLTAYSTFKLSNENVYSQYSGVGEGLRMESIKQGGRPLEDGVNIAGWETT